MMRARTAVSVSLVVAAAGGCTAASPQCEVGSDCASGACRADGTCAPVEASSTGAGAIGPVGGSGGGATTATNGAGGATGCIANGDGVLERAELPLGPGLSATFRVATNATIDTAGDPPTSDVRAWDLTSALPGDHDDLVETLPVAGAWYAGDFPGASYATPLSSTQDVLGVFELHDDGIRLRGVVSPTDGATRTELTYDPPATVLALPLSTSATFSSTSTVTGLASGVYAAYVETYTSVVDAQGSLDTPFGAFPVLRVRTTLTQQVGVVVTIVRTFSFVTECFGPVASIRSNPDEPSTEFSAAAEVQRLAP